MKISVQYATHSHDESEIARNPSAGKALEIFDEFDWVGQARKADELQRCSPTLGIEIVPGEHYIWVSSYGSGNEFISDCYFPGTVSSLFGLLKKEGIVNLSSPNLSKEEARRALHLFLEGAHDELRTVY